MADGDAPLEGYDDLNATDIVARLEGLSDEDVDVVKAYEAANQNRKTVVEWKRPAPPEQEAQADELTEAVGRPPLREVAEQASAEMTVEEAPNFGEEQ